MSLEIQKEKIRLPRITHSMRAAQAILQYGVGAMVDFPDQTLMTAAPEYWESQTETIHDERLERILRVSHFGMPGNLGDGKYMEGISYVRFPEWYFCPRCRKFQPISEWIKEFKVKSKKAQDDPHMARHMECPKCRQELVVTRIITVCEDGHIDDFPWVKWVHCQNYYGHKDICHSPHLDFKTNKSSSEGLDAIEITCSCGARASLRNAFKKNIFEELDLKFDYKYDFSCTGRHPWKHTKENCNKYPRAMQRGSSSVYFPHIESSLVIPPYSSRLTSKIEESVAFDSCKSMLSMMLSNPAMDKNARESFKSQLINEAVTKIAMEISVPEEKVRSVLERRWMSEASEEITTLGVQYRAEEYEALTGELTIPDEEQGDDFVLETVDVSEYKLPFIEKVSLIHKIREVQALTGFSRLTPVENYIEEKTQKNLVSIKEPTTDWYPAYQVRGEGIFIEINQNAIDKWRKGNKSLEDRVNRINENYKNSFIGRNNPKEITDKYLLLHSISHLLIKQLSFECGYGIASLKERIYCSEPEEGKNMSGILIYTASGDSEGTLGGLVRQGRADLFPKIFKKAIESAKTCSNDPVCGLSLGQGRDSLNLAACYSCMLIPETSCEVFNVFLDRGTVIGVFGNEDLGFYSKFVFSEKGWESDTDGIDIETKKEKEKSEKTILIESGTNVTEMNYEDIWKSVGKWIDDDEEKKVIDSLTDHSDLFEGKEKPELECDFTIIGEDGQYSCDMMWKKSKVLFFTNSNIEDYNIAQNSDWKCVHSMELQAPDELAKIIKEK